MNSFFYYAVVLDAMCLFIFLVVSYNLLASTLKNKAIYLILLVLLALTCLLDATHNYLLTYNCQSNLLKEGLCKFDIDFVMISQTAVTFTNLFIPYVIYVFSYILISRNVATREAKLLIFSVPFIILSYFVLSAVFNGYIQFKTFQGEFVHGKYYTFLVATVGFYSCLGLINILQMLNHKMDMIKQVLSSNLDVFLLYLSVAMPFILGPVNLLFDCAIVLPCYAVCAFFLMTIQQYLRISIDELTTVNNRNELNSYLDNLMLLSEKDRRSTFMMFIDLNKFKHINDTFGHNQGDVVLVQISKLLKAVAGAFNCFVCRYGGDEFILIKRHANEEKAVNVCKYIDESVTQLQNLSLAPYEISVSTGFVRFDNRFKTPKDFIEAADRLMYETKRSGKKDYSTMK